MGGVDLQNANHDVPQSRRRYSQAALNRATQEWAEVGFVGGVIVTLALVILVVLAFAQPIATLLEGHVLPPSAQDELFDDLGRAEGYLSRFIQRQFGAQVDVVDSVGYVFEIGAPGGGQCQLFAITHPKEGRGEWEIVTIGEPYFC